MVRDKNGRKMSKSLGNVVDPMEVIHGCELKDLLRKIDDGNLPEKEVGLLFFCNYAVYFVGVSNVCAYFVCECGCVV